MTGLFMLGIFVKRANAGSAVVGIIVSIIAVLAARCGKADLVLLWSHWFQCQW